MHLSYYYLFKPFYNCLNDLYYCELWLWSWICFSNFFLSSHQLLLFLFNYFILHIFFPSNFSSTFPLLLIVFTVSIFLLFTPCPFHWFVFLLFTDLSFSFSLICLSPFHWFVFFLFTDLSSSFSLIYLPPFHHYFFRGTNKLSPLASFEYTSPGRYTEMIPVYPPVRNIPWRGTFHGINFLELNLYGVSFSYLSFLFRILSYNGVVLYNIFFILSILII